MSYIIAIGLYLVLLMVYGLVIAHKKVKTTDDMVTGGHKIPFIILVGSLLATWCGGGGITGSAGVVYSGGPWVGVLTFAAPPIGIILLYFIAGKVRKSNKVTVPEIMGARYGTAASIISALCVMLAYVGVLATQLKAAANILVLLCHSSGIEISHGVALAICTVIIVIITVGGGLVSVAYSDAVSALIMIGGFFLAIPILMRAASAQGAVLPAEKTTFTGGMSGWTLLGYFLPSLALMLGDQNMLQRFASAKNSDEAKKSNIGMFIGEIMVIASIVAVATQAAKLYPTLDTPSNVIFQVAVDYLPMVFGALVMCACMAFIVTTADSYLLSSATNLTNDIYVKYINKNATDHQKMTILPRRVDRGLLPCRRSQPCTEAPDVDAARRQRCSLRDKGQLRRRTDRSQDDIHRQRDRQEARRARHGFLLRELHQLGPPRAADRLLFLRLLRHDKKRQDQGGR